jgi:DNA-directed RNA polymerase beta' subunit
MRPFERREDWKQSQGTLWDARVFGPREDWKCACGKFDGDEFSGVVCPICGVKVVTAVCRKIRFAHVNLPVEIPHPFFAEAEPLNCVPVIPIVHWESVHGAALAAAYDELVRVSLSEPTAADCSAAYGHVLPFLNTLYAQCADYESETRLRIARGLALVPKPVEEETSGTDEEGEEVDWDHLKLVDDD